MCAISAIFAYRSNAPAVTTDELIRIRDDMASRGPDGKGLWTSADKRIALGHRRLSIVDLSDAGAQPMATSDGELRVVFNGEIYNYAALRTSLEKRGYRFLSNCDTEVLLHLYRDRGPAMVEALRGMYAFALWDEKKRGVFLARDPFGIKPLYYSDDGKTLRVASQARALRRQAAIPSTLSAAGAVGFYLLGSVPEPHTLWESIRALPAGSTLWIDQENGASAPKRFYSFPFEQEPPPVPETPDLRSALIDTLKHHLMSDVPVGLFLSSGLDSATLLALTRELNPQKPLRTITLGFEELRGTAWDEVPLAEKLAQRFKTDHSTKQLTKNDFEKALPKILEVMDQPSIDGINTYFVSQAAAEQGLKVALSGVGGDEIFGSYPSFRDVPKLVGLAKRFSLAAPMGGWARRVASTLLPSRVSPKYAGLLEYGGSYGGAYLLRRGIAMPWELERFLDSDLVRDGLQELNLLSRLNQDADAAKEPHWKVSSLEFHWYLRNQLLRDADWAGMAHSLEIRVPWVDPVFLKNCYGLRQAGKISGKKDMAAASQGALPAEVTERPKSGFTTPVYQWTSAAENRHQGMRHWATRVFKEIAR